MKFYKKFISLVLILTLILSSTLVYAHPEENSLEEMKNNLKVEKQQILDSIYKQLESQNRESLYYHFEKEVEKEFSSILESIFPQEKEKLSDSTSLASISKEYTFRTGGSVVYKDEFFTNTTISKIFMTESQAQDFFNETQTSNIATIEEIILLFIGGTWGRLFSINSIALKTINRSAWRNVFDNSGRANIMTINDPIEGQATVIYEWTSYPKAYIEASEILSVKYGL